MKYVALLRGINVGGKNKVAMSELRHCFEESGYMDVSTYINSGNILFSSPETDVVKLINQCEYLIKKQFGFEVVVTIISADELINAVGAAPSWWAVGDPKEVRSEALYAIAPTTGADILAEIQKKSSSVDQLAVHNQIVFWSLPRASYNKSVVPKIIGTPIYRHFTMRSATTTKKLYELLAAR